MEIVTNDVVRIRLVDANHERYEVPVPILDQSNDDVVNKDKPVIGVDGDGHIYVARSTGEKVFDTKAGPIIFEDKFLLNWQ